MAMPIRSAESGFHTREEHRLVVKVNIHDSHTISAEDPLAGVTMRDGVMVPTNAKPVVVEKEVVEVHPTISTSETIRVKRAITPEDLLTKLKWIVMPGNSDDEFDKHYTIKAVMAQFMAAEEVDHEHKVDFASDFNFKTVMNMIFDRDCVDRLLVVVHKVGKGSTQADLSDGV